MAGCRAAALNNPLRVLTLSDAGTAAGKRIPHPRGSRSRQRRERAGSPGVGCRSPAPGQHSGEGQGQGGACSRGNPKPSPFPTPRFLAMAPALLLVPAALASFILAFGTGVEFVRFTSLRPLLGGIPESGGPGEREGSRMSGRDRG